MKKRDIAKRISARLNIPVEHSEIAIDIVLNAVMREVSAGKSLQLRGFGTFSSRVRKAKTGRAFKEKKVIVVPSCTVPTFKPSKEFKDRVQEVVELAASI